MKKKILLLFVVFVCVVGCTKNLEKKKVPSTQKKETKEELAKELFEDYYPQAQKKVESMTIEEKVGQLFLARMNQDTFASEISQFHPGGYILFARDFEGETKDSIRAKINKYQEISAIPLVMAVDEEGGTVTQVSRYPNFRSSRFASSQQLYSQGGFEAIINTEIEKIALLKDLGLNLNLAPVADVSTNPNDYMYSRSFGHDASLTSEYIRQVVRINYQNNFADSLKHFPGYGSNVDTHTGIAIDERSCENFITNDFLPFQAGISESVPTILVSHNIVKSIDESYPSSLSSRIHEILRDDLKFSGLIITDDLSMDAISQYTNDENSAVLAVKAGNDFIITSNLQTDYDAVLKAVEEGKITISKLDIAVRRILAFKYRYHIA